MEKGVLIGIIIGVIMLIAVGVLAYFFLGGAGGSKLTPEEKELPEDISQIDSIAENILQAINDNDYSLFSRDFSSNLKTALNEQIFQETKILINETSGEYLSKDIPRFYEYQEYNIYQYPCSFEKENVTLTLYFKEGSDLLEGIYLDSENLRKKVQQ